MHTGYKLCLSAAYDHGDLSRVYPLARGSAPLMVLAASAAVGADVLTAGEVLAVQCAVAGILTMALGSIRQGENRRLIPWALATAAMTTATPLVDGLGARAAVDLLQFPGLDLPLDGVFFGLAVAALRGRAIFRVAPLGWARGRAGGGGLAGAYSVVVWAMTQAPIALVARCAKRRSCLPC